MSKFRKIDQLYISAVVADDEYISFGRAFNNFEGAEKMVERLKTLQVGSVSLHCDDKDDSIYHVVWLIKLG